MTLNRRDGAHHLMAASGEESFWAWRGMAADVFDVAVGSPDLIDGFRVGMEGWSLGDGLIVSVVSTAQVLRRSAFTIARGRLDHYVVQLCRAGGYAGQIGRESVGVRLGDTIIIDLADTLHIETDDFEMISLVLPRAILAPLVRDPEGLHGIVLSAGSPQGALLSQHLLTLAAQAGRVSEAEASALLHAAAVLVAACTSVAALDREPNVAASTPSILRILHAIERNLSDAKLAPVALMREFGLSRAALYRLFIPYGGVAKYIRGQRLKRCFAEVTEPSGAWKRIAAIAGDWGFDSEATFSRSFREAFGVSPREARRAAMAGGLSSPVGEPGARAPTGRRGAVRSSGGE